MLVKRLASLALFVAVTSCSSQKDIYFDADWHKVNHPTGASPEVYGFYTRGCFDGGVEMAYSGKGYHLVRARRGRTYAHPDLVAFLEDASAKVYDQKKELLLISDLAQPRGGPPNVESNHLSHQTGLDVDIWYKRAMPVEDPKKVNPHSVLNFSKSGLSKKWTSKDGEILKLMASYDEVDRIFVTPRVKERMCDLYPGKSWLSKIRPWWGHTYHYHVRLKCPEGSSNCESQAPVPQYLGCGDGLAWWFSDEAKEAAKKEIKRPEKIRLPKQCFAVYHSERFAVQE
jgi:penicillin-insensitive murein endopeptidase